MRILFLFYFSSIVLWAGYKYNNALLKEHSPYLQQHAHNPIHWYPWGDEAFAKAKKENKLIFLSIGYSTCHWCHVMEEESFTDMTIAKMFNAHFVSIKVDREQYPQIDKRYQNRYRAVYGKRGGRPLSVFLSPKKEVFFIGTYIPKEEGYGSKGLTNLLSSFVALQKEPQALQHAIAKYKSVATKRTFSIKSSTSIIDKTLLEIATQFDSTDGGFATRPKFPEASKLELLLDIYRLTGHQKAFAMLNLTLQKMAKGGIYDQVGGGFFRYTVDHAWQIPHFEKMLYTNAELIAVYAKAYTLTGEKLYKKVVDESIAQMEKNYMYQGLYYAASDADSGVKEGGYFIYAYIEVKSALKAKGWKPKEIEEALGYMGIKEDGNIDGDLSQPHITSEKVPARVEALKDYLRELRDKRPFPFVDKKINTAWNAMMIKALFEASKIKKEYLPLAQKRLNVLLLLMRKDGVLYHQTLLGINPTQKALLEDYAFLIDALIVGYGRTYHAPYLHLAQILTEEALKKFYKNRQWYFSDDGLDVKADFDDRYYTAALSVMLEDLLRVGALTEALKYSAIVQETLAHSAAILKHNPASAAKLVDAFLRLQKGDVLIHAKKQKLLIAQAQLDKVRYPFLLSKVQESDAYLACKTTMCFAHDKNITKLIEKINKAVQ